MMSTTNREPKSLRRGKNFHKKIQKEWCKTAEGNVEIEKSMTKLSGRKGRMDIFIESDKKLVAIAEIKASDWDTMNPAVIRRNVKRQARQIWNYIESQLNFGKEVSPGVIFPKRPKNIDRMNLIEKLFDAEGVPVVWKNESIAERKARS
ncbi:MAG: hypothetical protein PHG85_02765 [Candidatus Altiarchaeota archaeon]|nr:hypothetical protein [Candidatus Altiarchaeota archaeon]